MSSHGGTHLTASAPLARAIARPRWRTAALLCGLAACYAAAIVARPLVAPDEFRYAEVPREMLASGDWIVPRLDGVPYFEKPPLAYWATAFSMRVFGGEAAAVRLPFAVSTLLAAAIVFALVRRYGAGERAAGVAALGFLTSIEVAAVGTAAMIDALFALGVTAALAALFVATLRPPGPARHRWLAASGAACGAAFLVKGFLAVAIPISVAVPYLVWSRRSRDLVRLPWTPLAAALVVAAPWSLAIARAEPGFWRWFVVNEHLRRLAGADAQHAAPFWALLPALALGALPWTSLLVPALRRRAALATPLARFCVCWLVAPLLLLSAASGKLATYVLPCFPPLFVLIAEGAAQPRARLARHLAGIAAAVAAVGAAGALALIAPLPELTRYFDPGEPWQRPLGAIGALATAMIAALALRRAEPGQRIAAIAAAMGVGFAAAALAFPTGSVAKTPERWLARVVGPVPADAIVVADRSLVVAVCWQLRRADVFVVGGPGELRYGLERADQSARWLDAERLEALIRDPARTRPVVVIGRAGHFAPPVQQPDRSDIGRGVFFGAYDPPAQSPGASAPLG
jgi:4-amino-4-deoxy-L-arabinose transferase